MNKCKVIKGFCLKTAGLACWKTPDLNPAFKTWIVKEIPV